MWRRLCVAERRKGSRKFDLYSIAAHIGLRILRVRALWLKAGAP